jgi:hypothetical protein
LLRSTTLAATDHGSSQMVATRELLQIEVAGLVAVLDSQVNLGTYTVY